MSDREEASNVDILAKLRDRSMMMNAPLSPQARLLVTGKFVDPRLTLTGETRASVALKQLETLWFNTGTLCNITCENCYIESSPKNDRLSYLTLSEVTAFLDEIRDERLTTREIAFTGGEPFMNPDVLAMCALALERGFRVLVLTNAMQPMQRPAILDGLKVLIAQYGPALNLRVSLDHFEARHHDSERGVGSYAKTLQGLDWLIHHQACVAIAGRTCWPESESELRLGYAGLFVEQGWALDAENTSRLILFPEMNERLDVPEITTACWSILNVDPNSLMCASSRMVVKRKGAARPSVLPCTLLPYDERFEMGNTLTGAANADGDVFDQGAVRLAHPHCAKFCVLGGGSCSA